MIGGGMKVNALPEKAWAIINHRVSVTRYFLLSLVRRPANSLRGVSCSSVNETKSHNIRLMEGVAREFDLTLNPFDTSLLPEAPSNRTLTLTAMGGAPMEPSPKTPIGQDSAPWKLLSGTIKATYNSHRNLSEATTIIVSPGVLAGNTGKSYVPIVSGIEVNEGIQILYIIGTLRAIFSGITTWGRRWGIYIRSMSVCVFYSVLPSS